MTLPIRAKALDTLVPNAGALVGIDPIGNAAAPPISRLVSNTHVEQLEQPGHCNQ